jgi:hypothetical protein
MASEPGSIASSSITLEASCNACVGWPRPHQTRAVLMPAMIIFITSK